MSTETGRACPCGEENQNRIRQASDTDSADQLDRNIWFSFAYISAHRTHTNQIELEKGESRLARELLCARAQSEPFLESKDIFETVARCTNRKLGKY